MNKKGFTLIEILAVIIILGVIMTIAIPNVLSMIERNKKDTFIEHAKMMATQAEYTIRKDVNIEYPSENKAIILTLEYSFKMIRGDPEICFSDWDYPLKCTVVMTTKLIEKMIDATKKSENFDFFVTKEELSPSTCNALIITDNLRVRSEPNLAASTKIIGKFNKWDDVHLIDCTKEKTKIDGLEYPWYKVQLENGQEGWIFGGFAKIYFSARDKDYLYKAFEKEGSEYTNQFVTPEEFY